MTQWIGYFDDMLASVHSRRDNADEGLLRQQDLHAIIRYHLDLRHERSKSLITHSIICKRCDIDRSIGQCSSEYVRQAVLGEVLERRSGGVFGDNFCNAIQGMLPVRR